MAHRRRHATGGDLDVDTAQRYDTPGPGVFASEVVGPTVDRLAELTGDGKALEFAIGPGRVAVPLAERGVPVTCGACSCRMWTCYAVTDGPG
jgi:hypothetical protein